jgi:5-methylcytosine-specific restriction endonuclease McrA
MPGPVCFTATNERSVASLPQHPTRRAYREYLRTEHWKQVRVRALEYADYSCQVCESGGEVHVHHRTYDRLGAERPADLTVLCAKCHALFHRKDADDLVGRLAEARMYAHNGFRAQLCLRPGCARVLWTPQPGLTQCPCGADLYTVVVLHLGHWERLLELLSD